VIRILFVTLLQSELKYFNIFKFQLAATRCLVHRSHSNGLIRSNSIIDYRWRLPKHCIDACAPRPHERTPFHVFTARQHSLLCRALS